MRKNNRIETSKKIILTSYIIAIVLSLIVVIGTFLGVDVSNITTIASFKYSYCVLILSVYNTLFLFGGNYICRKETNILHFRKKILSMQD